MTTALFVHIPKTGGTTLWRAMQNLFGKGVLRFMDMTTEAAMIKLSEMIADRSVDKYVLIGGHIFYDPQRWPLPSLTMLRLPVDRFISAYYHAKSVPSHHLYQHFNEHQIDLVEGLRLLPPNLQVRYLAAVPLNRDPTPADLDTAKANIERIEGLGLLERYHESLLLYRDWVGGPMPYYQRSNVSGVRPRQTSPEVLALAAERNTLDIELYNYAVTLFEQRLKAANGLGRSLFWFERTLPIWRFLTRRTNPLKSS